MAGLPVSLANPTVAQNQRALIIPPGETALPSPPCPTQKAGEVQNKAKRRQSISLQGRQTAGRRGARGGVIKRGTGWFKLIGSAVTSGPQERLGVLTTQSRKPSQAGAVIGGRLGPSGSRGAESLPCARPACGVTTATQEGAPGDPAKGCKSGRGSHGDAGATRGFAPGTGPQSDPLTQAVPT